MATRKPKSVQPEALEVKPSEPVVKASVVKVKNFDPDAYIRDTYGELYDIVAIDRAMLRELVILNHRG